ncbi:MAG: hypothetical protein AABZ39_12545, partial [Spirochaetota bacterium]
SETPRPAGEVVAPPPISTIGARPVMKTEAKCSVRAIGIAGAAVKDHGNYRTMFIGSSVLSRYLINAIASYAGAWVVTKPNAAVVSASDSLLMIHAFKTGTLPVTMKKPSSLAEYEPGARTFARSARHEIMVKAGNTYLFRIKD